MSLPARRYSIIAIVVLSAASLLGGHFGTGLQADSQTDDHLRMFSQVLAVVEDNYVGEATSREMVESAIQGLLRGLDPHSNYLSRDAFREMRDEQRGRFYGLGIQIAKRGPDKPLTIIAPIDDTPAANAGLEAGDIIFKIEGEETIELTVQDAVRRLKGDKGTKVTVTIKRPGLDELFDVTLIRDEIPIESLRVAYMLQPGTGFVRISNFTSTTSAELDAAIKELVEQGMERLILDLRGNPGGLLEQAVQVSERFLPAGQMVVFTKGRVPGSDQQYRARDGVEHFEMPLIVLVNQHSASASEIVSGAIQDHDRGLVIGETTFGKGLVQRVIPLRDGGALAVTTAKYYTPSGRMIQRDYSDIDDYYFDRRPDPSREPDPDVEQDLEDRKVFLTDSGRKVYGGGGITPDYIVKPEPASTLYASLGRQNLFFDFSVRYAATQTDLKPGFRATPELFQAFKDYLHSREFEFDAEEFEADSLHIGLRLRAQISRVRWDMDEESRVLAEADPHVQKALTLFGEAESLARLDESEGQSERAELLESNPSI